MKRVVITFFMLLLLTGCNMSNPSAPDKGDYTIVCTGFSQYDWIMNILGDDVDNWNIIRLNEKGTDMHSYQPSVKDISSIIDADLVVYTGGMSEKWIAEVIEENENFRGISYCLLTQGEAKEELTVEGMFTKGHSHEHSNGETGDHEHGHLDGHHEHSFEYDEHIWLSPKNAMTFCRELAWILGKIEPSKREFYTVNGENYISELIELDHSYSETIGKAESKTLVFADRFPFRYLTDDYGIAYYAAFPGCSAETEANFDTIIFLAGKLNELSTPALMITESSDDSMAQTIIKTSGQEETPVYRLNSLQSVTEENTTYIDAMEQNLQILNTVLN